MRNLFLGGVAGFGLAVVLLILLVISFWPSSEGLVPRGEIAFSSFIADLDNGKVNYATFEGSRITGGFQDGRVFKSFAPHPQVLPALTDRLLAKNVTVAARPADDPSAASVLAAWTPFLICYALFFGGVWFVIARPMLALTRQLEGYIRAVQQPSPDARSSPP